MQSSSDKDALFAAWAAGFLDGEGWIGVAKYLNGGRYYYALHVKASNTCYAAIEALQLAYGGSIQQSIRQPHGTEWYSWDISTRKASAFLRVVLPYLRVKKLEAQIALEYQALPFGQHTSKGEEFKLLMEGVRHAYTEASRTRLPVAVD